MKYEVTARLIEVYCVEVEADSETEAIKRADEILDSPYKHQYHEDSDAEFTAYEV